MPGGKVKEMKKRGKGNWKEKKDCERGIGLETSV